VTSTPSSTPTAPAKPSREPFPEVVLTLAEAAWAAGLSREQLQQSVRSGELKVRRVVRAGRVVPVVAMKELERVHVSAKDQREESERQDQRQREQIARLEGELETSERVERSLQRYTDRLEDRMAKRVGELENALAISRQRELTLARALGRIEGQYTRLSAQVEGGSDQVAEDGPLVQESEAR